MYQHLHHGDIHTYIFANPTIANLILTGTEMIIITGQYVANIGMQALTIVMPRLAWPGLPSSFTVPNRIVPPRLC
jgi:hypothetical protein